MLLEREEILQKKIPIDTFKKNQKGIYFLLWDNDLIYIGSSNNLFERINAHIRNITKPYNFKVFNNYYYVLLDCSDEDLLKQEYNYINKLKPRFNRITK